MRIYLERRKPQSFWCWHLSIPFGIYPDDIYNLLGGLRIPLNPFWDLSCWKWQRWNKTFVYLSIPFGIYLDTKLMAFNIRLDSSQSLLGFIRFFYYHGVDQKYASQSLLGFIQFYINLQFLMRHISLNPFWDLSHEIVGQYVQSLKSSQSLLGFIFCVYFKHKRLSVWYISQSLLGFISIWILLSILWYNFSQSLLGFIT